MNVSEWFLQYARQPFVEVVYSCWLASCRARVSERLLQIGLFDAQAKSSRVSMLLPLSLVLAETELRFVPPAVAWATRTTVPYTCLYCHPLYPLLEKVETYDILSTVIPLSSFVFLYPVGGCSKIFLYPVPPIRVSLQALYPPTPTDTHWSLIR